MKEQRIAGNSENISKNKQKEQMFLNKMENIVLNETKYGWPSYTKTTEFKPYDTI